MQIFDPLKLSGKKGDLTKMKKLTYWFIRDEFLKKVEK